MQSVPITTRFVNLYPVYGDVYSIQFYLINFVSNLRQVCGVLKSTPVSSTNKSDCHSNIAEIIIESDIKHLTFKIKYN